MPAGALLQLVAWGAADAYLITHDANAHSYNIRDSMMYCFVGRADGHPIASDLEKTPWDLPLHFGDMPLEPQNEKKLRYARKIQRSWRTALANPEYRLCRRRLAREFQALHESL